MKHWLLWSKLVESQQFPASNSTASHKTFSVLAILHSFLTMSQRFWVDFNQLETKSRCQVQFEFFFLLTSTVKQLIYLIKQMQSFHLRQLNVAAFFRWFWSIAN